MAQATGETRREVLPKQNVVPLQEQSSDRQLVRALPPPRRHGSLQPEGGLRREAGPVQEVLLHWVHLPAAVVGGQRSLVSQCRQLIQWLYLVA